MCLSHQSRPHVGTLDALLSVSLSKEVISGIPWSRKGQPAARVKTSVLNLDTYCLIYSSFTFQKLFTKHQGYARFILFSHFSN